MINDVKQGEIDWDDKRNEKQNRLNSLIKKKSSAQVQGFNAQQKNLHPNNNTKCWILWDEPSLHK